MPEVDSYSTLAGGAEITSYNLESNLGSGTVFSEVVGFTTEQLNTEVEVSTTPGTTYLFRYRVKNMFGFSINYSPEVEIKSAKSPNTPTDVQTSIVGHDVKIAWTAPDNNYDTITRYEVQIRNSELDWIENTLTCDGADETIKQNTECYVSLLSLLSGQYNLLQGENVNIRVAATNNIGTSDFETVVGVLIETVPLAPAVPV
jgi:hypothetical protein